MKKIGTLNQPLSETIAGMGHLDTLVIADAGLPIPQETHRIDLALKGGTPGFVETLEVVLSELQVERAIVAEEMIFANEMTYRQVQEMLKDTPIETISHAELKDRSKFTRAVVRTGEFTPYANIILVAGVVF